MKGKQTSKEWIKCGERLPPVNTLVIGWNYRAAGVWIYELHQKSGQKQWRSMSGAYMRQSITHWMPMPEPPREY